MHPTPPRLNRRHFVAGTAAVGAGMLALPSRAQSGDIVLGQSAHLSGPLGGSMLPVVRGQQLAIDEFNRKGGAGGRKVRLIALDDVYDPKKCLENVNRLIDEEKVTALYGLASAANIGPVLPILAEKKIPLICAYTGAPALRAKHHPYFFTTMASFRDEVVQMIRNLVTIQRTKIAVGYHASPFGQQMLPLIDEVAKENGATVIARAPLAVDGKDAAEAAQKLGEARPEAVLFIAFGPALVGFVKAARSHIGAPVYALSVANSKSLLEALGDDARGLAFTRTLPFPLQGRIPLTQDYAAAMARAKHPLDIETFFGYANMRVMLEAVRRAGRGANAQSLVAAMESMNDVSIGGYKVSYSPTNHHGSKYVEITVVGPGGRFIR